MIDTVEAKFPFHKVLNEYISVLKKYAENNDASVINLQNVFDEVQKDISPELLTTDGIHPTDLGHSIIAEELLKVIQ